MGINPAMGMGFGGDDFYTQMLYQQMMNGGAGTGAASWSKGGSGKSEDNTVAPKKKIGLFEGALTAAGVGGGTYLGMNYLNHGFNSPIIEEKGKIKFTDDFLAKFSGEYATIQNESAISNFYKKYSTGTAGRATFTVDAKNYESIMEELRNFVEDPSNPKVADMSDDLKGFLKQRLGKEIPVAGTVIDDSNRKLYELVDDADDLGKIRDQYAEMFADASKLEIDNNYNLQKSLYESFDDVVKGMKDCTTPAAKAEYLKSNAHAFGLDADDMKKIIGGVDTEIDDVWRAVEANSSTRKGALKTGYETAERAMQQFASKWDPKAGILGKGKFNVFSKKTAGALENALSALRKGKGGRYGAIAAAGAAGLCLLFNA